MFSPSVHPEHLHHDLSDQSHPVRVLSSESKMLRSQPNTVHDVISDESHAVLSFECNMLSSQPKITGYCNESSDSDSDDSESQSDEEVNCSGS